MGRPRPLERGLERIFFLGWPDPRRPIDDPSMTSVTHRAPAPADTFYFGRFRLVAGRRELFQDEVPVAVGSRAFDLLVALVERAGETIDRSELLERVWPDVFVAKVNLRVHIARLRKALGDDQAANRFIVSVAGRGYRFIADVRRVPLRTPAVCIVDLAATDDAGVAKAVAAALGCEAEPQGALAYLLTHLRTRDMLLAFNNCAHVFGSVAQLTERLFVEAPHVQVLISGREAPEFPSSSP